MLNKPINSVSSSEQDDCNWILHCPYENANKAGTHFLPYLRIKTRLLYGRSLHLLSDQDQAALWEKSPPAVRSRPGCCIEEVSTCCQIKTRQRLSAILEDQDKAALWEKSPPTAVRSRPGSSMAAACSSFFHGQSCYIHVICSCASTQLPAHAYTAKLIDACHSKLWIGHLIYQKSECRPIHNFE